MVNKKAGGISICSGKIGIDSPFLDVKLPHGDTKQNILREKDN